MCLLSASSSVCPSPHFKLNWSAVSSCNFYHDHTFVSVAVIKRCSSPWPLAWGFFFFCVCGLKCITLVCRDFRKKLTEGARPPSNPTPLSGSHLLVWMSGIAVSLGDEHDCRHEKKPIFDSRLKLTATQFHHPLSSSSSIPSQPCCPLPFFSLFFSLSFFFPHPDFPVMTSVRVHSSVITNLKLVIWPEMALAVRISADKGLISQPGLFVKNLPDW